MDDQRARAELLEKLDQLSQQVAKLAASEAERKQLQEEEHEARVHTEAIVDTVRDSLVVLGSDLRVISANRSFYETFRVAPEETETKLLYELGNRQWDIPRLRELLEDILSRTSHFRDFEVDHEFPTIGRKVMLLNARRIYREGNSTQMILLAMEDITERKRAEEELQQRLRELEALNRLFQEHLRQRFTVVETHQELLKEVQRISLDLNGVLQRALSQPLPDLQDVANTESGGGEHSSR